MGHLDRSDVSQSDGEPLAIFNTLAPFDALGYLNIQYDALFGSAYLTNSIAENVRADFLPQLVRTLHMSKCPPVNSKADQLDLISQHARRCSTSVDVIINWLCESYKKESINVEAFDTVKVAHSSGLSIDVRYLEVPEGE